MIFFFKWHHDIYKVKGAQMVTVKRCIRGGGQIFRCIDSYTSS